MSQPQQPTEVGGRNTRARAKKLEDISSSDYSILLSDNSHTKKRRLRNVSSSMKDSAKTEANLTKSISLDKSSNIVSPPNRKATSKRSVLNKAKNRKRSNSPIKKEKATESNSPTPRQSTQNLVVRAKTEISAETADSTMTPKNSPVVVNLSARRSSKTPKRSPKGLASPKSHGVPLIRISKTPRKLILPSDSPMTDVNTTPHTLIKKSEAKTPTSHSGKRHRISGDKKILRNSPTGKSKIKRHSISMKPAIRRFSKSPVIVLKNPKTTSRKSRSPKSALSPKRYSLGGKANTTPENKHRLSVPKSEPKQQPVKKFAKNDVSNSATPITSNKQSLLREVMTRKTPVVILERLSMSNDVPSIKINNSLLGKNETKIAANSPIISSAKSSPLKGDISISSDHSLNLSSKVASKPNRPSPKNLVQEDSPRRSGRTVADNVRKSVEPLMSSTPYDRKKHVELMNASNGSGPKVKERGSPRERVNRSLSVAEITKSLIEDESEPFLYQSSLMAPEETVEKKEEEKEKDGTYELSEPKTPHLRQKVRKRSSQGTDLKNKPDTKKSFKVRFATPTEIIKSTKKDSIRQTEKGRIEKVRPLVRSNSIKKSLFVSGATSKNTLKSIYSGKLTNSVVASPRAIKSGHQGNSSVNESSRIASPNVSLSKRSGPSDSATKNSATKKVPNFAKIHDKLFAKSESLVDAKKRLAERHTVLTSTKLNSSKVANRPKEPANGPYNRFGFKIRKNEAIDYVMKRNPVVKRRDQQQKNRDLLKGVRTNRRFELQMKARNIKI